METTVVSTIIELTVNNHPGVMSHITGLFTRRAFNLEGILCGPVGDGSRSRMFLLVNHEEKLEKIISQLEKLYDVLDVKARKDCEQGIFSKLGDLMASRGCGDASVF